MEKNGIKFLLKAVILLAIGIFTMNYIQNKSENKAISKAKADSISVERLIEYVNKDIPVDKENNKQAQKSKIARDKESKKQSDAVYKQQLENIANKTETQSGTATVENSEWDGSVSQVKKYLKENLNDAKSYKPIKWSAVVQTTDGYQVAHSYRAKNAYGGYVIQKQIFYLNRAGEVTSVSE